MKRKLLFIFFVFSISISISYGQTIYGITGLIKTPDAYIIENGKCIFGMAYYKDYHSEPDILTEQWTINFNIGFHSRFELGVRLAGFPGTKGDSYIYDMSFDRILNFKYLLFKEKKILPQLAIGMQDIVGTRFHNSSYIIGSKAIALNRALKITFNLGYGCKLNDLILGDASNHHFIGFFGGGEIGIKNTIFLVSEYDAKDLNAGFKLAIKDWLKLSFSWMDMKTPSAGLSLKFTI